jgi:hypothetical protein
MASTLVAATGLGVGVLASHFDLDRVIAVAVDAFGV